MKLFSYLGTLWCRVLHPLPMWPICGHYICPRCLRRYSVNW